MSDTLLRLYHELPAPARSIAATLRGAYLQWWRFGADSERLIAEAHERERWSADEWTSWRDERLSRVLHRAATRVPYYRDQWAARRRAGDHASWDVLANWPVLTKQQLRTNPRAFVADDRDVKHMFHQYTSGTTGTPLDLWRSRATQGAWYAIAMARTHRWHGLPRGVRWARLGGQVVTPIERRKPPFWVWNAAARQLYLSTYHISPDFAADYLDAMVTHRIRALAAYPSSAHALAEEAVRLGRCDVRLDVVFTNAEPVSAAQRAVIETAFCCRVRETYGMGEAVAGASECVEGRLHQWPEAGIIETIGGDGAPVRDEPGEFICTGLLNDDMPLVRYQVGDVGQFAGTAPCPCGRTLPVIAAIAGRANDLLITRDGRRIFWLNSIFYGLPIRQSQIIQESFDRVRIRYAPGAAFSPADASTLVARMLVRVGDMRVELEEVDEIPRSQNGKLRAVICNLPERERTAVLARASA